MRAPPGAETPAVARHDLLVVPPEGWRRLIDGRPPRPSLTSPQAALLERWGEAGWPVIARRRAPGDDGGSLPVGVPLPPDLGKVRVALALPPDVARRRHDGLSPSDARASAPPAWHRMLDAVETLAGALGLRPLVFGALLWQALTGLRYLHAGSDLDLLWPVADAEVLARLLDGLTRIDAEGPARLDGEVLIGADGVNWRELDAARRGAAAHVLAKGIDGVRLLPVERLFARGGPS